MCPGRTAAGSVHVGSMDTYGRLTLVTTESHRHGGASKLERAVEALTG